MGSIIEVILPAVAISLLGYGMGFPLLAVAALAGALGAGLGWRYQRRRVAEETRRTVMASVMDVQNNFLNNMVYFQTRAAIDGEVTPADLSQIDCAIRETQAKLIEIADAGLTDTRDLGGIKVLDRPRVKSAC